MATQFERVKDLIMEEDLLRFIGKRCERIIAESLGCDTLNKMSKDDIENCINGYTLGIFSDIKQMQVLFYL